MEENNLFLLKIVQLDKVQVFVLFEMVVNPTNINIKVCKAFIFPISVNPVLKLIALYNRILKCAPSLTNVSSP